jgi:hypothetical protein
MHFKVTFQRFPQPFAVPLLVSKLMYITKANSLYMVGEGGLADQSSDSEAQFLKVNPMPGSRE